MLQTKFLFMDEKYGDHRVAFSRRIVALTGVLVATDRHGVFRDRFYRILSDALPSASNVINRMPIIHASKLLPDAADDNVRCDFIERLVSIVVDFDYKIYRVGYYTSRDTMEIFKTEKSVPGLCFSSILSCLESELSQAQIWPVMETDHSPQQDQLFAGAVRNIDYYTARLQPGSVTLRNSNLGELLYTTKFSVYGCVADCVAYLLHLKFLASKGYTLSGFKQRLANISTGLEPCLVHDEIIELKIDGSNTTPQAVQ